MTPSTGAPRLLIVGGSGGLVGRAVLPEFMAEYEIRSVHRHPVPAEPAARVEWIPADIARVPDWRPILEDVDVVLNLAWYRWGNATRFRHLCVGLERLVEAARSAGTTRFLQVSVPPAPDRLERSLPYLAFKRRIDRAIVESGLSYRIVRPTMLFGPGDRLLGAMLRVMRRYPVFPMFGDGAYHLSPVAVTDLARILHQEAAGTASGTIDVGGPDRFRYRDLTDLMYDCLGKRPRYWRLSQRSSVALGQLVQDLGSSLLYAYEVEWLLSDLLGPPAFTGLASPMTRVEPYLREEARRLRRRAT
jgi:NADH dehydrogenase